MGMAWMSAYYTIDDKIRLKKNFNFLFWGVFAFSWIGAKLFYLIHSGGETKFELAQEFSFWLGGGFVFYGGFLIGTLFALMFCFLTKTWQIDDLKEFLPGLILGHAIGRVGCFMAGCCFGIETDSLLNVFLHQAHRHPVQLYEAFGLSCLYFLYRKYPRFEVYLAGYGILRFSLEFIRGDLSRGFIGFFSQSQWIALCLITLAIGKGIYDAKYKKNRLSNGFSNGSCHGHSR